MDLKQWTRKYDGKAKEQGWTLFNHDGVIKIQRLDDPEEGQGSLESDAAAIALVFQNAAKGDQMSLAALFLDGKNVWDRYPILDGNNKLVAKLVDYPVPS